MPEAIDTLEVADAAKPIDNKDVVKDFRAKIESSKRHRRDFAGSWKHNIEERLGKLSDYPGTSTDAYGDESERSLVNPTWSLTKTKTANLFSQVPAVQITHENPQYGAAIPPFARALNYELGEKRANVGVAMEEVLNDAVNAFAIGFVNVGYAARFETVEVPAIDLALFPPEVQQDPVAHGVPMKSVERVVDYKFTATRFSASDGLWPAEFTGSNFDDGDFIGLTGRTSWSEAKVDFKLTDEQKEKVMGGAERPPQDDMRSSPDNAGIAEVKAVTFDEIYYWRYRVDPDEKSFSAIWRLVLVHGLEEPAIHEPWKGQQYDQASRKYLGNHKFPIRVLTLTYVSDNPVCQSETEAIRPQVNDMRRSRSQMFMNRDRSRPLRWHNTDRMDPLISETVKRGTWQNSIPVQGDGTRVMGEVARASYPAEDFEFDRANKADMMESIGIGPNQQGTMAGSGTTATESNNVQTGFATRNGKDQARVTSFFLGICEVLAGWMVLYSDFPNLSDQERQTMEQAWNRKAILHDLVLKIRPDSAVVLDVESRWKRLERWLNITGKSGEVENWPTISEMAELTGLDPSRVKKAPAPPTPPEPNISYRFSGKDDLVNPLVMGMLVELKKAPSPESIKAAIALLQQAAAPPEMPGGPNITPSGPPAGQGAPGAPGEAPPGAAGPPEDWSIMEKISKRSRDLGEGA